MKRKLGVLIAIVFGFSCLSQTVICQGFEGTANTWSYTAAGTVNTELARTGTRSLRLGRGGPGTGHSTCPGPLDGNEIVFDPITIIGPACSGVFSFYHRTQTGTSGLCTGGEGMDAREGFAVYVKINNGPWTPIGSFSATGDMKWTWLTAPTNAGSCGSLVTFPNPFVYNVPVGTTIAQFKIISIGLNSSSGCGTFASAITAETSSNYDRGDEGFFIDDVCFQTYNPCTLPILLNEFSAKYFDSKVILNWTTLTEVNNDYFTVERSRDGVSFEIVGTIKGMGSTLKKQNYTFTDHEPYLEDVSYYRLKNTDYNGSYAFSKLVSVRRELALDLEVYPNPSQTGEFFLITDYFSDTSNFYEIFDYSGKKVMEQKLEGNKTKVNISMFARGLYMIKLTMNGQTVSKKLMFN